MQKSRAWCFTDFETKTWNERFEQIKLDGRVTYLVAQEEKAPETGRLHIQGYIYCKNAITMGNAVTGIKGILRNNAAHCSIAKGSPQQNRTYCTKPDTRTAGPWEHGELPQHGGKRKRNESRRFASAIIRGADVRELARWDPYTYIRHCNGFDKLSKLVSKERRPGFRFYYIFGDSGVGKTSRTKKTLAAMQAMFGTPWALVNVQDGFLHGYNGEAVAFYDEFTDEQLTIQLANKLCDHGPNVINTKGGSANWHVDTLIIASNCPPGQLWIGKPFYNTFQRRLNEGTKIELEVFEDRDLSDEIDLTTDRKKEKTMEEILAIDSDTEIDEPEEKKQ